MDEHTVHEKCVCVSEKDLDAASCGDIIVCFIDGWRTLLEAVFINHIQHTIFEFHLELY